MKFPKPWRLEQCDRGCSYWVTDANDRKLFHIGSDDPGDPEHEEPGSPYGPTVLEYSCDEDTELILDELTELFTRQP